MYCGVHTKMYSGVHFEINFDPGGESHRSYSPWGYFFVLYRFVSKKFSSQRSSGILQGL